MLIKAKAKVMSVELRIAAGGLTDSLKIELENAQGAEETIRELLESSGKRRLRESQIQQQATNIIIASTGRTPQEIVRLLHEKEDSHLRITKTKTKVQVRLPATREAPKGDRWARCCSDFEYFCKTVLRILYRPGLNSDFPDGGSGTFHPNDHQLKIVAVLIDEWLAGKPIRVIILKARQLGITTALLAFWFWIMCQREDFVVFFMIDKDPHMYEKRDMILGWIARLETLFPDAPCHLKAKGGKRIVLKNGSKFLFESAHSPNPGTSEQVHAIHLSEKPKWPKGKAALVDKSLLPGQSSSANTFLVDESTAQGLGDFYKKWDRVMKGKELGRTKTLPIFLPWFLSPEYSEDVPSEAFDRYGNFAYLNEDREVCETDDYGNISITEEEYARKYNMTNEQIYWRRLTIKNDYKGVRLDFDQEYPTTPEHAWAAFGTLFFGTACALEALKLKDEPIVIGHIVDKHGNNDPSKLFSWTIYDPKIVADRTGPVRIYERPIKNEKYYVGGDIAEGKMADLSSNQDPDYSVIPVLHSSGRLVAIYRARTRPEEMALPAILLAKLYNLAKVNIERNSVGEACWAMFMQSGYARCYVRDGHGPYRDRAWNKCTKANRKSMLIEMRHHIRRHPEHVRDEEFAKEIANFVTNPLGKPEAMSGHHDDIVMAYCHAWHMIYDIDGVRVTIVEPKKEEAHELEFFSVLEHNGIDVELV